jgi:predicted DNA-binding transcriptional regulator AlpA
MRTRGQAANQMPNGMLRIRSSSSPGPRSGDRTVQLLYADPLAFSIPEFCRRHGISRAHFYNLFKSGHAPALMRVGRRTLISAEAAAEWRRRMEQVASDNQSRGVTTPVDDID